jgi:hypothetical protein
MKAMLVETVDLLPCQVYATLGAPGSNWLMSESW